MQDISGVIKQLFNERGKELVTNPKLFCSILDDILSECQKERNILHKVLIPHQEICNKLYELISLDVVADEKIVDFRYLLKDGFGFSEEWIDTIFDVFDLPNNHFRVEQTQNIPKPKQTLSLIPKNQPPVKKIISPKQKPIQTIVSKQPNKSYNFIDSGKLWALAKILFITSAVGGVIRGLTFIIFKV